MKTITKEYKIYEFDELSDVTKQKVLEKLWDINVEYDWWEGDYWLDSVLPKNIRRMIDNNPKHILQGNELMFSWKDIAFDVEGYRGFLSFSELEVNSKLENEFRRFLRIPKILWNKVCYNFVPERNRNTNITVDFENNENEELTNKENIILDRAKEIFDDLISNALKSLEKQYEYLQSEEAIIETIKCNDYQFLENGEIFR